MPFKDHIRFFLDLAHLTSEKLDIFLKYSFDAMCQIKCFLISWLASNVAMLANNTVWQKYVEHEVCSDYTTQDNF